MSAESTSNTPDATPDATPETPKPLNLTEPVPFADFAASVNAVWTTVRKIAIGQSWCPAWTYHLSYIAPGVFPRYDIWNDIPATLDVEDKFASETYRETLRTMRGAIIWYRREDYLNNDQLARILAAARLALPEMGSAPCERGGCTVSDHVIYTCDTTDAIYPPGRDSGY